MSGRASADSLRTDFVAELNEAIRLNPLPAALIGAGCVWLFMAGTKNTGIGSTSGSIFRGLGHGAQIATGAVSQGVQHAASSVAAGTAELGAQARHAASLSMEALGSAGSSVSSSVQGAVGAGSHAIGSVLGSAQAKYGPTVNVQTQGIERNLNELLEQHPLLLGVVGIAVGAALAAALPATDMEKSIMGDAADAAKEQAVHLWDTASEHVQTVSTKMAAEAKEQGLTSAGVEGVAQVLQEKVKNVVETVKPGG